MRMDGLTIQQKPARPATLLADNLDLCVIGPKRYQPPLVLDPEHAACVVCPEDMPVWAANELIVSMCFHNFIILPLPV